MWFMVNYREEMGERFIRLLESDEGHLVEYTYNQLYTILSNERLKDNTLSNWGNIKLFGNIIKPTVGDFSDYSKNRITVLQAIHEKGPNSKIIGYVMANYIGVKRNYSIDRAIVWGTMLGLTNGIIVNSGDRQYIKCKKGSWLPISKQELSYSQEEIAEFRHSSNSGIII